MSNQSTKPNRGRFIIQLLALTLILVVLPMIAWYGLQRGYDYRKAILEDLNDLGQIESYQVKPFEQDSLTLIDLEGKVLIATFMQDLQESYAQDRGKTIKRLVEQFGQTQKVIYLIHSTSLDGADNYQSSYLENNPNAYIVKVNSSELQSTKSSLFKCGNQQADFAVVDSKLTVRNCYSDTPEDMKRLVEHVSVLTPRDASSKPIVKRKLEK